MIPIALLSALLLLFFYYQSLAFTLLSLIPFFSGLGLFALAVMILHLPLSFISVIAIVMIFGLSFDYGIFATNLFVGMPGQSVEGVWTSLVLSALVSLGGFAPMIFCKHPVLIHLGEALTLGTIGTLLGAIWGIPGVYNLWQHFKKGEVND